MAQRKVQQLNQALHENKTYRAIDLDSSTLIWYLQLYFIISNTNPHNQWYFCSSISTSSYPLNFVLSDYAHPQFKNHCWALMFFSSIRPRFLPYTFSFFPSHRSAIPVHTAPVLQPWLPPQASIVLHLSAVTSSSMAHQCSAILLHH